MTINAYRFGGAAAAAATRRRRTRDRLDLRSTRHGPLMSTVGYAQRRGAREMAAKERRKKFLAFGGVGLLGLVLFIQVPKTLDMLESDSSSATSSSVVVTPSATPQPAAEAPRPRPRFLRTARVDDPFAGSRAGAGESRPGAVGAPAGLRDPFQLRSATPAPPPVRVPQRIVVGTPGTRAPRIGYTVVLASIPTSNSRASGGAVRPHGSSTRRRWRRRPQVVCS